MSNLRMYLRRIPNRPILWLATVLHLTWGVLLVIVPETIRSTTGLAPFSRDPEAWGLVMFTSGVLALAALSYENVNRRVNGLTFWALIPQQMFLMVSAFSVVFFTIRGHYASGTVLPQLFILTDQLPKILLALAHPMGMWRMHSPILPVRTPDE